MARKYYRDSHRTLLRAAVRDQFRHIPIHKLRCQRGSTFLPRCEVLATAISPSPMLVRPCLHDMELRSLPTSRYIWMFPQTRIFFPTLSPRIPIVFIYQTTLVQTPLSALKRCLVRSPRLTPSCTPMHSLLDGRTVLQTIASLHKRLSSLRCQLLHLLHLSISLDS